MKIRHICGMLPMHLARASGQSPGRNIVQPHRRQPAGIRRPPEPSGEIVRRHRSTVVAGEDVSRFVPAPVGTCALGPLRTFMTAQHMHIDREQVPACPLGCFRKERRAEVLPRTSERSAQNPASPKHSEDLYLSSPDVVRFVGVDR
ncbi:hypothetical protein Ppa06_46340 [Planomonospora parontospora subsp. parontospora]|uniref:Uncharacterized protein n=2 Tax=Planomonospora parontospora TaxID=58119 RepID=A0AA37BLB6_9ACTN|nr:hypothetical protein GCM10010126_52190 [Planomonospora parontospora]GII10836.1 hypothetical protein Ppa06_46340 [Planomonospora parontospora subsp. parontospora]